MGSFKVVEEGGDFWGCEVGKFFELVVGEEGTIEAEVHFSRGFGDGGFSDFIAKPVEEGRGGVGDFYLGGAWNAGMSVKGVLEDFFCVVEGVVDLAVKRESVRAVDNAKLWTPFGWEDAHACRGIGAVAVVVDADVYSAGTVGCGLVAKIVDYVNFWKFGIFHFFKIWKRCNTKNVTQSSQKRRKMAVIGG